MSRKILLGLLGAALSVAVASRAMAGQGGTPNGGDGSDKKATAPEIHPAGLAATAALLLGGVALITAHVGRRKGRAAHAG
jgi:hypothetical protein